MTSPGTPGFGDFLGDSPILARRDRLLENWNVIIHPLRLYPCAAVLGGPAIPHRFAESGGSLAADAVDSTSRTNSAPHRQKIDVCRWQS